jgi:hypothetical protein
LLDNNIHIFFFFSTDFPLVRILLLLEEGFHFTGTLLSPSTSRMYVYPIPNAGKKLLNFTNVTETCQRPATDVEIALQAGSMMA